MAHRHPDETRGRSGSRGHEACRGRGRPEGGRGAPQHRGIRSRQPRLARSSGIWFDVGGGLDAVGVPAYGSSSAAVRVVRTTAEWRLASINDVHCHAAIVPRDKKEKGNGTTISFQKTQILFSPFSFLLFVS